MSTLTEQIAEALPDHQAIVPDHENDCLACVCGYGLGDDSGDLVGRHDRHCAEAVAAVVADWLDAMADAHNDKIATIANAQRPLTYDTATAHGMRRAATEARKGADQ